MDELSQQETEQAVSEIDFGALTDEQTAELERRLAAYRMDPDGSTLSLDGTLSLVNAAIRNAHG